MARPLFFSGTPKLPEPFDRARAQRVIGELSATLSGRLADEDTAKLIGAVAGNSPYLSRLMLRAPGSLARILSAPAAEAMPAILARLEARSAAAGTMGELMAALREAKRDGALALALADIAGFSPLRETTAQLSCLAGACVNAALRYVLREAVAQGRFAPSNPQKPEEESGLFVVAMGKLGAGELNYSSDIDIAVFFDGTRLDPLAKGDAQAFAVRVVQSLVRALQEKTPDGYVFRVDLRLRPDAGSTQVAISTRAAELYYECMGQNWERAAMIKARAIAGDLPAGEAFLRTLQPFVFRKYLDYAAIEDIHSIKRQIHAHAGHGAIAVHGHDLKLGRGGIREIEFFVQTQQLILGGRIPELRGSGTVEMLRALRDRGHVSAQAAADLEAAYVFLRTIEHRLQMIEDQQTHTLPGTDEGLAHIACFMGYGAPAGFERDLRAHLENVERHYAALFESAPPLSEKSGSLVFTGVEDDPDTLVTLERLGFTRPRDVANAVRGWHHGRIRATRSERAREKLTALMPALLDAMGATANPDLAFAGFDRFLAGLPAGVQVFSLLYANPSLLGVLTDAFGTAPRLAGHLARYPQMMDAMLAGDFLKRLPDSGDLETGLTIALSAAANFEDILDRARRWQKEEMLRIGLHVVRGRIQPVEAGSAFTHIAECLLRALLPIVAREFEAQHGPAPGAVAVVALGKLGAREMTATSDLDLVFVYDCTDGAAPAASQYFVKLAQRLIAAVSSLTSEGRLYEIDMRLRPTGNKGPVATRLSTFVEYHRSEAWTWERMALTRARVVAGPKMLSEAIGAAIAASLWEPRDAKTTRKDIAEMRARMAKELPSSDIWELKHVRGGLVDLEFIAQGLQLMNGARHPNIFDANTVAAFGKLQFNRILGKSAAKELVAAARLQTNLLQALRIATEGAFDPDGAGGGLKNLLARAVGEEDFAAVEKKLKDTQHRVRAHFKNLIGN